MELIPEAPGNPDEADWTLSMLSYEIRSQHGSALIERTDGGRWAARLQVESRTMQGRKPNAVVGFFTAAPLADVSARRWLRRIDRIWERVLVDLEDFEAASEAFEEASTSPFGEAPSAP